MTPGDEKRELLNGRGACKLCHVTSVVKNCGAGTMGDKIHKGDEGFSPAFDLIVSSRKTRVDTASKRELAWRRSLTPPHPVSAHRAQKSQMSFMP